MRNLKGLLLLITLLSCSALNAQQGSKPVYLWVDGTANFRTLSYPDSILLYLDSAKEIGVTDIVVDVKPISGEVLYPSQIAPVMTEWKGFTRPQGVNYLQFFIDQGHLRGLKVHASLNIFAEGHIKYKRGNVFKQRGHWKSMNHSKKGLKSITEFPEKNSAAVNPLDQDIQDYELSIVREIVTGYNIDGIIFDRARYESIESDFSHKTEKKFEQYTGKKMHHFPADIFTYQLDSMGNSIKIPGEYYKKWVEFRASVLFKFFQDAKALIKSLKPALQFGNYNGGWYPYYYEHGVNWASVNYDPSYDFSEWATPQLKNYSILNQVDYLLTGCFYYAVDTSDVSDYLRYLDEGHIYNEKRTALWESVEGTAGIIDRVTMNEKPAIGSLYLLLYRDNPSQLKRAIKTCLEKTDGLMLFDAIYLKDYHWWKLVKETIQEYKN